MGIRTSKKGLEIVEAARKQRKWQRQDQAWCTSANVSLATLKRFLEGKSVSESSFQAICKAVCIENYQEIVDQTYEEMESSVIQDIVNPPVLSTDAIEQNKKNSNDELLARLKLQTTQEKILKVLEEKASISQEKLFGIV